jgi:hypothetical protein
MNQHFRNHVTGTAFSLQLSAAMIRRLLMMDLNRHFYFDGSSFNLMTLASLRKRGLICHAVPEGTPVPIGRVLVDEPHWVLTDEGRLVVLLLKAAGFSVENDPTVMQMVSLAERVSKAVMEIDEEVG